MEEYKKPLDINDIISNVKRTFNKKSSTHNFIYRLPDRLDLIMMSSSGKKVKALQVDLFDHLVDQQTKIKNIN